MSRKHTKIIIATLLCLNLAFGLRILYRTYSPHTLTVTFLDVGQGDSAVIEAPSGRVIVIDTGGTSPDNQNNQGRKTVEPFLRARGINHLDAIILTHPHADHIGGADTLINDLRTDLILDNGEPTQPPLELQLLQDADKRHVAHREAVAGQTIDLGEGAQIQILAPTPDEAEADKPNNASIVVMLTYGSTRFLFMGDAERAEEGDMVNKRLDLRCSVLKVGHHGSDTSSTQAFISAAHPAEAVVSVGENNRYGHPSLQVIARLKAIGAHVDRTDQMGAVICESDGSKVRTRTMSH